MSLQKTGLFIGAITESGTTCSRWGLQPTCAGIQRRDLLALFSGCFLHLPLPGFSSEGLVKCLRSKTAVELLNATQRFPIWMHVTYYPPVLESSSAPNPVITHLPWFDDDNSTELVPWITGVNSNEAYDIIRGSPLSTSKIVEIGVEIFLEFMLPDFLYYRYTAHSPLLVTEKLKLHYFHLVLYNFIEFGNQVVNGGFFYYPMRRCLRGVKSPTYAYYFNYTQPNEEGGGVPHTRELIYSWDMSPHKLRSYGKANDIEFSKKFVDTWIDFAYYQSANFSGVEWDKYNSSLDNVLIINNDEIKMGTNPSHANNTFWETLNIDTNPKNDFCIFY